MFVVKIKGIDDLLSQLAHFLAVPGVYYQIKYAALFHTKEQGKRASMC